jgi:hypothetical protein
MRIPSRVLPLAAAALLALLPARAMAQQADSSSVDAAILDVLLARGIIDQAQYDELMEMARAKANESRGEVDLIEGRLERLRAPDVQTSGGAPQKLLFKSPDGKWSMAIKGRIQARVEDVNSDDNTKDGANFSVPRARLGMEGNAGAENVKYRLEMDLNTQKKATDPATEGTVTLRQGWISWGFENGTDVLLGQTEFPFGREAMTSTANQQFGERSIVFTEFEPEYEPLGWYHGTMSEGKFEFWGAVSNGEGRGKNNTPGSDNNGLREGVRVAWNPMGAVKNDGPAFQTYDTGETRVSIGANLMRNNDSSALNTVTPAEDSRTAGLDAMFFSGPFSLTAEALTRDGQNPAGVNDNDKGLMLEGGWLLTDRWEVCARRAQVNYDNKDDQTESALGVNYYVDKHNGKWQLEWNHIQADGVTASQSLFRVGYQLMF